MSRSWAGGAGSWRGSSCAGSADYLAHAAADTADGRVSFRVADAQEIPAGDDSYDFVVSGLVLNFVPDPALAVTETRRMARRGGVVAAYVWDYCEGMRPLRHFWDVAVALDPSASDLDEGRGFTICRPHRLAALWRGAGLADTETLPIEVDAVFDSFDDYWTPFLGGQGPAPGYCVSLPDGQRRRLKEALRARLPAAPDDTIRLPARAWAVRGLA